MTVQDRILLIIYPLVIISLAVLAILVATGWDMPRTYVEMALATPENRLVLVIGAALVLIVAAKLLVDNFRRPQQTHAVIRQDLLGGVHITLTALEHLVIRVASRVKGVRDVRPRIRYLPEGLAIFVRVVVAPEIVIPDVAGQLQQEIKASIEEMVGISVLETRVLIDGIGFDLKSRVE